MELPFRIRRLAHRLRKPSSKPAEISRLNAKSREDEIELAIVDTYNDAWNETRRGSRLTLVRSPLLRKNDKVMTIGSCFAREIRRALEQIGFDMFPKYNDIRIDPNTQKAGKLPAKGNLFSHYNTFTIRNEFERALRNIHFEPEDFVHRQSMLGEKIFETWSKEIWQDPYRKSTYAASQAAIVDLSRSIDACVRDAIMQSDLYVITLGLTEIWRNNNNGLVVNQAPSQELGGHAPGFTFECSTYEQNYENMRVVCSLIQEHFPQKKIVLTVSPVALARTFSGNDIIVANTESKSTLRAVAAAISREFSNVTYWPSYEISLARDIYRADGRHVTVEGVKAIVDQFVSVHLEK